MLNIKNVGAIVRVSKNEYHVEYGEFSIVLSRVVSGWESMFKVVVKGPEDTQVVWNYSTPTAKDKVFWEELTLKHFIQKSEAHNARTSQIKEGFSALEKD
jgi:hypothetical protein